MEHTTGQQFFWVNHSKKHHEKEIAEGSLIAATDNARKSGYREILGQAKTNDVVFVCHQKIIGYIGFISAPAYRVDVDDQPHWKVDVHFEQLKKPIHIDQYKDHLTAIKSDYLAPIDKSGTPGQGAHISQINLDMASFLMAKADIYLSKNKVINIEKGAVGRVSSLEGLLHDLSYEDVLWTIKNFDTENAHRYQFGPSSTYDLMYEGLRYPPKAILGLAAIKAIGRGLISSEFTGGENSECFKILRKLGFSIELKEVVSESPVLMRRYTRKRMCELFTPNMKYTAGSGKWGISGIVSLNNKTDDIVFIVTLEEPHEGNPYLDYLTDDGILSWQTQSRMKIDSPKVRRLIGHDSSQSNIHLFLRTRNKDEYAYYGLLDYLWHDELSSEPVLFQWRLCALQAAPNLLDNFDPGELQPGTKAYTKQQESTKEIVFVPEKFSLLEVDAPVSKKTKQKKAKTAKKTAPKYEPNWAEKDEKNRKLGYRGELLVIEHEKERLIAAGRQDLADKIEHVAMTNHAAGYDILSFDEQGNKRLLEVKTTGGSINTPFFISKNEVEIAKANIDSYFLYRVHEFDLIADKASLYIQQGSVEDLFELEAVSYRAWVK